MKKTSLLNISCSEIYSNVKPLWHLIKIWAHSTKTKTVRSEFKKLVTYLLDRHLILRWKVEAMSYHPLRMLLSLFARTKTFLHSLQQNEPWASVCPTARLRNQNQEGWQDPHTSSKGDVMRAINMVSRHTYVSVFHFINAK